MNEIETAINWFDAWLMDYYDAYYVPDDLQPNYANAALSALREKLERESAKPLTIEELREMEGEPVWIVDNTWLPYGSWGIVSLWPPDASGNKHIYIYDAKHGARSYSAQEYGRCWTALRHKPKEEHHATD